MYLRAQEGVPWMGKTEVRGTAGVNYRRAPDNLRCHFPGRASGPAAHLRKYHLALLGSGHRDSTVSTCDPGRNDPIAQIQGWIQSRSQSGLQLQA